MPDESSAVGKKMSLTATARCASAQLSPVCQIYMLSNRAGDGMQREARNCTAGVCAVQWAAGSHSSLPAGRHCRTKGTLDLLSQTCSCFA